MISSRSSLRTQKYLTMQKIFFTVCFSQFRVPRCTRACTAWPTAARWWTGPGPATLTASSSATTSTSARRQTTSHRWPAALFLHIYYILYTWCYDWTSGCDLNFLSIHFCKSFAAAMPTTLIKTIAEISKYIVKLILVRIDLNCTLILRIKKQRYMPSI